VGFTPSYTWWVIKIVNTTQQQLIQLAYDCGLRSDGITDVNIPDLDSTTRVYRADDTSPDWVHIYLLDTPGARRIVCEPHLVGKPLISICENVSAEAGKVIRHLNGVKGVEILHLLRAAPVYGMVEGLGTVGYDDVSVLEVHPKYVAGGTGDHRDVTVDDIRIRHRDYDAHKDGSLLVIPDTIATATALRGSLMDIEQQLGCIPPLVLTGFIAEQGLGNIVDFLHERNYPHQLHVIPWLGLTTLGKDGYQMLAFLPVDVPYARILEEGESDPDVIQKKLLGYGSRGGIMAEETLRDIVGDWPLTDFPGDWSERGATLWNGRNHEKADNHTHAEHTIRFMDDTLRVIEQYSPPLWDEGLHGFYTELIERKRQQLQEI